MLSNCPANHEISSSFQSYSSKPAQIGHSSSFRPCCRPASDPRTSLFDNPWMLSGVPNRRHFKRRNRAEIFELAATGRAIQRLDGSGFEFWCGDFKLADFEQKRGKCCVHSGYMSDIRMNMPRSGLLEPNSPADRRGFRYSVSGPSFRS